MYTKKEFSLIEIGGKVNNNFRRHIVINENDIDNYRKQFNNTDVYRTVFNYNNVNQNESLLYGPLYFDLDNPSLKDKEFDIIAFQEIKEDAKKIIAILEAIFYIPKSQIEIYFSGNKGLHIVVPPSILGIQPLKNLNEIYKFIVKDVKKFLNYNSLDTQIYDRVRLFRLVNSINSKSNLYKIPLSYTELTSLSCEDIKLLATQPREFKFDEPTYNTKANRMFCKYVEDYNKEIEEKIKSRKKAKGKCHYKYTPPCIQYILDNGVNEGNRNNTIAVLASYYKQNSFSLDATINKLLEFNKTSVTPPIHTAEIEATVNSIFNSNYGFGCSRIQALGVCDECIDICKIAKKKGIKHE